MKRIICIILVIVTVFSFVACGKKGDTSNKSTTETEDTDSSRTEAIKYVKDHYSSKYGVPSSDISVEIASLSCIDYDSGIWQYAGKVYVTDKYGDTYSANWSINYTNDEDRFVVRKKDLPTPTLKS